METSPKLAAIDTDNLSSSPESSEDDGGQSANIEDCNNETKEEQQIVGINEVSSISEVINQSSMATIQGKTLTEMGYEILEFGNLTNQKSKANLYERLQSMIRENKRPDLTVKIGETEFRCYSIVLQCYSRIFFKLKKATNVTLPTERVSPKSFKILYDWMISEIPTTVSADDMLDLLDASTFLSVNPLTEQGLAYFNDESIMTEDKAFLTFLEAKKRNFEFSNQLLNKRIKKFFLTLVAYEEFVKLSILDICVILNSSNIGVNSELETFMAAIRWLNYDWNARKEHTYKLMECIRFNLVAPWLLTSLQRLDAVEEVSRVVSMSRVRQLINAAIAFTSTRLMYVNDPANFSKFLNQHGLFPPLCRQWIYDNDCSYHHKHSCGNMIGFGYKDFLKYLKQLRKKHKDYWQTLGSPGSGGCQCGCSELGFPDVFKTDISLLLNFDKKNTQANIEKFKSQEQEKTTTNPFSMQENTGAFRVQEDTSACSEQEDTGHTGEQDDTSVSSVQEESRPTSIQEDTGPTSVQEDTGPTSGQEDTGPSRMPEDKLKILLKRYTIGSEMSEDEILDQSVGQVPMDMNTKPRNSSCSSLSSDNSVYWYQDKRDLKLTSSESIHQPQKLMKCKEMLDEQNVREYHEKEGQDNQQSQNKNG